MGILASLRTLSWVVMPPILQMMATAGAVDPRTTRATQLREPNAFCRGILMATVACHARATALHRAGVRVAL